MLRKALLGLSVLTLCACGATSGRPIDNDKVAQFKPGVTKVADVIQALGPPTMNMVTSDGSRIISYAHTQIKTRPETFIPIVGAFVGGADANSESVVFTFDRNGTLQQSTGSQTNTGANLGQ